jgi:hypothetical protein
VNAPFSVPRRFHRVFGWLRAGAAPDLLIRPNVTIFRTLDFPQATAILRTAEAVKAEVKDKLGALLG